MAALLHTPISSPYCPAVDERLRPSKPEQVMAAKTVWRVCPRAYVRVCLRHVKVAVGFFERTTR